MAYKKDFRYTYCPSDLPLKKRELRIGFKLPYVIVDLSNWKAILDVLLKTDVVSYDTETTGLDFDLSELVCFSFRIKTTAFVVFVKHSRREVCLPFDIVVKFVEGLFSRPLVYFFNVVFDLRHTKFYCKRNNYELNLNQYDGHFADVMSMIFITDTNVKDWSLKSAGEFFCGFHKVEFDFNTDITERDPVEVAYYSAHDAYITYELGQLFYPIMEKSFNFLCKLDRRIIVPLLEFEDEELLLNKDYVEALECSVKNQIEKVNNEFWGSYGFINMNSPDQVRTLLVSRGLNTHKKTLPSKKFPNGQMSTDEKSLKTLGGIPLVRMLLENKHLVKLLTTLINKFTDRIDSGLPIRCHYKGCSAATWRFSSGKFANKLKNRGYFLDVNFQALNKPKEDFRKFDVDLTTGVISFNDNGKYKQEVGIDQLNVRKCIIADKGYVILSTDFKSQEIVIATNYSREPVWLNALKNGEDIHRKTAEIVWGVENYNSNLRKIAKTVVFALLYGGDEHTISQNAGISLLEATDIYNKFRQALPTLFKYMDEVKRQARLKGYTLNHYGLPRRLAPYYRSGDNMLKSSADRIALNTNIQSSAAVVIRLLLVKLHDLLLKKYKPEESRFMLMVHDEVNFYVLWEKVVEFADDLLDIVSRASHPSWEIKLGVDMKIGNNFGELVGIEIVDGKVKIKGEAE